MKVKLCTQCPNAPRDLSGHYDPYAVLHLCAKCDGEQVASTNHYARKTHRRQECATAFNIDAIAQPNVARSVMEGLASSDTTAGEPPSAPGSAPTDSRLVERTTADFYLVFRPPNNAGGYPATISRSSPFWNTEIAQVTPLCKVLFGICLCWGMVMPVQAQDGQDHTARRHPPQDQLLHEQFYATWHMPDNPNTSCCNDADCYPTVIKYVDGNVYAKRREDGKYIPIPPEKIESKRDNPDGRNHLCAPPPNAFHPSDTVFCFTLGGAT